jgi:PIN domain nuclease of toxin-antitoxin system
MLYLDTHIVAELCQGDLKRFSRDAKKAIDRETDLRISPMVLLELEYLHEIGRLKVTGQEVLAMLASDIGLRLCDAPFGDVVRAGLSEAWTRDTFDRLIVAQAKAQKASLITRDTKMHARYAQAFG